MASRQEILAGILAKLDCTDLADVRKAYHRKALMVHPDKPTGSDEAFQEVKEVYDILTDPQLLEEYIESRIEVSESSGASTDSSVSDIEDFSDGSDEDEWIHNRVSRDERKSLRKLARYFMFPKTLSDRDVEKRLESMLARTMEMYHLSVRTFSTAIYDRLEVPGFFESMTYIAWIRKTWDVTKDVRYNNFIAFTRVIIMIHDLEDMMFGTDPPTDYSGFLLELEEAFSEL